MTFSRRKAGAFKGVPGVPDYFRVPFLSGVGVICTRDVSDVEIKPGGFYWDVIRARPAHIAGPSVCI